MNREPCMEMHQVRYFLAVARHFNFTRAAEELRVTQPSLTRAVQKLESELGGPLFRRERSNTHLTELGRMMLPHLEAAFASAETAKRQAQRLQKRDIGALALGVCIGIELRGPVSNRHRTQARQPRRLGRDRRHGKRRTSSNCRRVRCGHPRAGRRRQ